MPDDRSLRALHIPDAQHCDGSLALVVLGGAGAPLLSAQPLGIGIALSANTWLPFSSKPKIAISATSFPA